MRDFTADERNALRRVVKRLEDLTKTSGADPKGSVVARYLRTGWLEHGWIVFSQDRLQHEAELVGERRPAARAVRGKLCLVHPVAGAERQRLPRAANENARLLLERNISLLALVGLIEFVLLARAARAVRERFGGIIRVSYPDGRSARIPKGFSVLEASRSARIPHASVCGGRARCSTCRIRVIAGSRRIPAPGAVERAVLDKVGAGPLVRLACQLRPENDIAVVPLLPPHWTASTLRTSTISRPGEERFIVVMIVDIRNSSRLAVTRLPFDVVFIIDRFINAVGAGVTAAGGVANHFTGDGLMATFGLDCGAEQACRQAVNALGLIGRNVAALNRVLAADMAETIAFGVGVHGSTAVVGEVGYGQSRVFTTLGDAANVAARLETACKDLGCEAVISETVLDLSGWPGDLFSRRHLTVRGREAPLVVHTIDRIEVLHDVPHESVTSPLQPFEVPRMDAAH